MNPNLVSLSEEINYLKVFFRWGKSGYSVSAFSILFVKVENFPLLNIDDIGLYGEKRQGNIQ